MSDLNLTLTSSITAGYQVGYSPLTLTLNPSGLSVEDGAIVRIDYDFTDGYTTTVNRQIIQETEIENLGDPRNYPITHSIVPSASSDPQLYNLSVKVTRSNTFKPIEYIIPLYVYKVNAIDGLSQGYFEDIHMVMSRCYGEDSNKLYAFETVNPRYITFLSHSRKTLANVLGVKILHTTYQPSNRPTGYELLPLDNHIIESDVMGDYYIDFNLKNNGNDTLTISGVYCDNLTQFYKVEFTPITLQPGQSAIVTLSAITPERGSPDMSIEGTLYIESDLRVSSIKITINYLLVLDYISWSMNDKNINRVSDISNLGYDLTLKDL